MVDMVVILSNSNFEEMAFCSSKWCSNGIKGGQRVICSNTKDKCSNGEVIKEEWWSNPVVICSDALCSDGVVVVKFW